MAGRSIVVNNDYQRSSEVWPTAARSYLIDTILLGFPIPKITLYQKTDLKSRQTIKEIVDGQQRSKAIEDFFNNELRVSGKSDYSGLRFSDLDEENQQQFLDYQISADILVAATPDQIRQLFRRINSYTVPLNAQEQRHATHQGMFKWFMVDLTEKYSQTIKDIGVLKERQLSRMADAQLFTEIIVAIRNGIHTYSKPALDKCYLENDEQFTDAVKIEKRFDNVFAHLLKWESLHEGPLMKAGPFYSLFLAITHVTSPMLKFRSVVPISQKGIANEDEALRRLSELAEAIESDSPSKKYEAFVAAVREGTNTKLNRITRFKYFCRALTAK